LHKSCIGNNRNEESLDDEDDIEWEATMDTSDEVHGILMHRSPGEIRFYYQLMLNQTDDQHLNGEEKTTKNDMWQQFTYKQFFEENVEDDKHGQSKIIFRLMKNTNKKMKDENLKHEIFSKRGSLLIENA
jgi:hypothetical protein